MISERRLEKMRKVLSNRQRDLTVVCENIHDPHNVSAILRSCDAVGVDIVHLLYTIEAFPELGKKSSASAKKWIEIKKYKEPATLHETLKKKGFTIYATHISETAKSIFDIDWTLSSAIVVGNEHRGVSEEVLEIADETIYIPMFGMVESLNVSVATAVILYEACRQRISKGMYPANSTTDKWFKEKLKAWVDRN